MVSVLSIGGLIAGVVLVAPLVHDLKQKQALGTAYSNIGRGFGEGVTSLTSFSIAPKWKPEFIPKVGFQLELPDWLTPK